MENQMEKNMENEMETREHIGVMASCNAQDHNMSCAGPPK